MSDRLSIDPARHSAELLNLVREKTPLVQCITNKVVTNVTANTLLALGAAPAMVDIRGESGIFAGIASGLLVNLGTPTEEQRDAAREAVPAANAAGTPWVLDPVAVGSLPVRTALAHELLVLRPTVIRGNASEIMALAGAGAGGRGVDASDSTDSAADAAAHLAAAHGSVVAVSGPVDLITDGRRIARIANGDPLLTLVTGGGCALGAVTAASLAVADDPFAGAVAATLVYTVAAELAATDPGGVGSVGPGTFAPRFLDALAQLTTEQVVERARVRVSNVEVSGVAGDVAGIHGDAALVRS
ncbi:hydroxyethylthiazole kinase [Agromyces cerinus]|uniref:Hydroxyethylthiazole kinase n=1 Tax=Agromyces cerinus subsp. cerinus TaxID=232089 RepID=A0A1N6F0U5_9MICO|nr:hydroxyethylthiazole kinase [Agromyces cerinus]SIN88905.1 hydroxyethylthiazole kinase [Agromyces cerinus subsp. cerinus]